MKNFWLLPFVFFSTSLSLLAQDAPSLFSMGIETGPSVSFSGINFHLLAKAEWKDHEFILGPKIVLSDTYLISRGPWGINAAYRWNMVRQNKRMAFASLEYQAAFLKPGITDRKVTVHETHLAYGFQWQLSPKLRLGNSLGIGGVVEKSKNIISGEVNNLTGFSVLFKLFVNFDWTKRKNKTQL